MPGDIWQNFAYNIDMLDKKEREMIRDTEITILGRRALVAAEHAATLIKKNELVTEASRLQALAAVGFSREIEAKLVQTMVKIQRINRKIKRENMVVIFPQQ